MAIQWGISPSDMKANYIGSYHEGGDADIGDNSAQEWVRLSDRYWNATTDVDDAVIHPLHGVDAVHGHSNVPTATLFPHNIGLGCANDSALMRRIGKITAKEMVATGVDWAFAPSHAVAQNWRWGRTYESFSHIPDTVERLATELVVGLQGDPASAFLGGKNVLACAKHFGGDGGTEGGLDRADFRGTLQELKDTHLSPYFGSIQAGVQTIMASFNSWNGVKAHGNEFLLRDMLKRNLGFTGLVVGDWWGHEEVDGCSRFLCEQAVEAGVDVMMVVNEWRPYLQHTISSAKKGDITAEKIDDSVRRILTVKALYGAMTTPTLRAAGIKERAPPSQRPGAGHLSVLEAAEHRETAREAVQKSLVMLKNGVKGATGKPIPLSTTGKYLVAGRCADNIGLQNGGWTKDWQGSANYPNHLFGSKSESIYEGIKKATERGGSATLHQIREGEIPDLNSYDGVIFCTGESPYSEYLGDRHWPASMEFGMSAVGVPETQFLNEVRIKYPSLTIVTILCSGRPLYMNEEMNLSDAFIAAWLPGTQGGGVADVLFGKNDFVGKLSFQWPLDPCLTTQYNGTHGDDPPFSNLMLPIGYGLAYDDESPISTLKVDHLRTCTNHVRTKTKI
ncbi:unnamed protein product [Vitrella brassicaformis CCMP3155]|uniref:Beta-glucosidase n=1 Tax=Vitrella brassicaformis (strain CCMP3155) TaxID=1169540 RepID=A0A0G4H1K8_VITBC|nr:unnamed protein product [Vitrella brassicaformis CCMP3155]|eukprot:CEM37491.1 unnamed protein product [Vitrella brassicaformis CCMP3155]